MTDALTSSPRYWRLGTLAWGLLAGAAVALGIAFESSIVLLTDTWTHSEEYSHGWLIPGISAFLVWQKKNELAQIDVRGSWAGVGIVLFAVFLLFLSQLGTVPALMQYAFIIAICGVVYAYLGWTGFRLVWVALLLLFFTVPLPAFLYNNISAKLQLISSEIGVWVIRQFGITVGLEGNVIDLGTFKLQVVEACNGLRYLFPLMTIGVVVAVFFQAAIWMRLLVFFSTIPITVLMNSFRIGVIGVTVEYWGQAMAEGFLHDFEGWVIFMACFSILFLEMWLLVRVTGDRRPFREIFGLDLPAPLPTNAQIEQQHVPAPLMVAVAVLVLTIVPALTLPQRVEAIPPRQSFAEFPLKVGDWVGRRDTMEQVYLDALKFKDYIIADYTHPEIGAVNLYVAYYDSQRSGESAHSPRSCLPGGGWHIVDFGQRTIEGAQFAGQPLRVNRAVIELGQTKQVVYYWFQQRGRIITNEYLVKWYLFWDSLTRNRSDGALVRLVAAVPPGADTVVVDDAMARFARDFSGRLDPYVPN